MPLWEFNKDPINSKKRLGLTEEVNFDFHLKRREGFYFDWVSCRPAEHIKLKNESPVNNKSLFFIFFLMNIRCISVWLKYWFCPELKWIKRNGHLRSRLHYSLDAVSREKVVLQESSALDCSWVGSGIIMKGGQKWPCGSKDAWRSSLQ